MSKRTSKTAGYGQRSNAINAARPRFTFRTALTVLLVSLASHGSGGEEGGSSPSSKPVPKASEKTGRKLCDWPPDRTGLLFLWRTAGRPALARDARGRAIYAYELTPRGRARFDRHGAMVLQGGSLVAEGIGDYLVSACKRERALTIEALLTPHQTAHRGSSEIISLSSEPGSYDVRLCQEGDSLTLRLGRDTEDGRSTKVPLCSLKKGSACHFAVTWKPGLMVGHVDGTPVVTRTDVPVSFTYWGKCQVTFGAAQDGARDWAGTLEGIAIYSRFLSAREVRRDCTHYSSALRERRSVPRSEVVGRLRALSTVPTYKEVAPYFRALAVYEYEVTRVINGDAAQRTIRVAHWAMMDRKVLGISKRKTGEEYRLQLEPFEANRQLESEFLSDTLPANWEVPLYYDIGRVED